MDELTSTVSAPSAVFPPTAIFLDTPLVFIKLVRYGVLQLSLSKFNSLSRENMELKSKMIKVSGLLQGDVTKTLPTRDTSGEQQWEENSRASGLSRVRGFWKHLLLG